MFAVLAALVAGCGHADSATGRTGQEAASRPHPEEWKQTVRVQLPGQRDYAIADPDAEDVRAGRPLPLVVGLPGLYQVPSSFASVSRLTSYGRAHHFVAVYGEGVKARWNAGACCAGAATDDVQYLTDVVADVSKRLPIDLTRVYLVGFSNGGMMALRAACERPDVFAAVGVMSGALTVQCAATPPRRTLPVRVRQLHGADDHTVPPDGSPSMDLPESFLPLDQERAHLPAGSTLDVTVIPGLAHHWAELDNSHFDATDEFWHFLQKYHR